MLEQKRDGGSISISERHKIIQEYLTGNMNKKEVWYKYTGQTEEHGNILRWMRMYGYADKNKTSTFASDMKNNEINTKDASLENAQLKKKIKELEKALEYSELKATAFSTMIDVAEEELKISIRKK